MQRRPQTEVCATKSFQEIDPWNSEDATLKRRNLPHFEAADATYFVTFRSTILLPPDARDLIMIEIHNSARRSIDLDAAVVMPDHVHLIFRLLEDEKLGLVLKLIKGRAARSINQLLRRQGRLWIEESFDHVIRYEAELEQKVEYIRQNPVKKSLVIRPEDYRWLIVRACAEGHRVRALL
jgi:REP element-mobilizing transposase RayT